MFEALACALLAAVVFQWNRSLGRERALAAQVATLGERVSELGSRVDAAEADVAHAVTQAEIAEGVLLEKGVADEDDIEAVRRRFDSDAPGAAAGERDGELH
jgi:hypothetical protein